MKTLNVGSIPFLNAKPVAYGLEMGLAGDSIKLQHHPPAECARLLGERKLDVGLIPSIEYARKDGLWLIPEIAISSFGPSTSVLLFLNKPVEELKTIALDSRSRTSVALLKILSAERYNIDPEFVEMEPDYDEMLKACDAALIIGDLALYSRDKGNQYRDLSEDWLAYTDLPFVFAFWAGLEGVIGPEELKIFHDSLAEGRLNIQKISSNYPTLGMPDCGEINEKYLTENIRYSLAEDEITGLKLFYIKAWENGLIDGVPRIRFYES